MDTNYLTGERQVERNYLKEELQHLLVMRPHTIGEVVMLSPVLRTLKEALPHVAITLLTSSRGTEAAPLLPWVDEVMIYPALWREITEASLLNLRKDMAFIEQLREQRFSMAMIFTGYAESPWPSAYACYLAGIPHRVGFAEESNGSALSHVLFPPDDDFHQVDRNLNLLQALGIYDAEKQMELSLSDEIEKRANKLLSENGIKQGTPYLVLAPDASLANHRYDPHHFAAAARLLAAQTEMQMVIVSSSDDLEAIQPILQFANENLYGNVHSLMGKLGLSELAAVIRGARLTITNRSASMYLAEAFQCPMIVIYPGTDRTSAWYPRSISARVLSRPASCALCFGSDCRYGRTCLDIRPEEVAVAALEMLGEQTTSSSTYHLLQEYKSEMSGT
jgi:lipopolysaccharide heptosyltransferase II